MSEEKSPKRQKLNSVVLRSHETSYEEIRAALLAPSSQSPSQPASLSPSASTSSTSSSSPSADGVMQELTEDLDICAPIAAAPVRIRAVKAVWFEPSELCDMTVTYASFRFHLHRAIVKKDCDTELFSSDADESGQPQPIQLPPQDGIGGDDLETFFTLLYTSRHVRPLLHDTELSVVLRLYQLAAYFNVGWLLRLCEQDLVEFIDREGTVPGQEKEMLQLRDFASRFRAESLLRSALYRIARNMAQYKEHLPQLFVQLSKDEVVFMLNAKAGLLDRHTTTEAKFGRTDIDIDGNVLRKEDDEGDEVPQPEPRKRYCGSEGGRDDRVKEKDTGDESDEEEELV